MPWNITTAAPGTGCTTRHYEGMGVIPVAAYRANDKGETQVLLAPHQDKPTWVPLEDLDTLRRPGRPKDPT
jgi:hypothetical protein